MQKKVFISYSSEDTDTAEKICSLLETEEIDCWIAPRDISPGAIYAEQISRALKGSEALVLICSSHTGKSVHVRNEVELAFSHGSTIIPFSLENAALGEALEYFLAASQRIDAWKQPLEASVHFLIDSLRVAGESGRVPAMRCPSCGFEEREGAKFCANCGEKLKAVCAKCGHELIAGGKFCDGCGARITQPETSLEAQFTRMHTTLSPSVKRRLSLAADGEIRLVTLIPDVLCTLHSFDSANNY